MVVRRAVLAVKIPGLIATLRVVVCGSCFLIFRGRGRRRHAAHWAGIGGVHRTAVLLATHHVTEGEENSAEQHNAEEQSYQVPAFKDPVATASASAA